MTDEEYEAARAKVPDFWNLAAVQLHGKPKGWIWGKLNSDNKPEDFVEVQGAKPEGVYKSGPRKGRPKYPKQLETLWIRRSEIDTVRQKWESETGICSMCGGCGQFCFSLAIVEGKAVRKYRTCDRCKGKGGAK